MLRKTMMVGLAALVPCIAALGVLASDLWSYVGDYAPIVEYNTLIVDDYPTGFLGEYSGYCTYALPKATSVGYTFQYWFYYRYDIRISRSVDAALD